MPRRLAGRLYHAVFDQGNEVGNRHESLCLLFTNLVAELVFDSKDGFHYVQTVSAQILDQMGFRDDVRRVDFSRLEVIGDGLSNQAITLIDASCRRLRLSPRQFTGREPDS